MRSIRYQRRGQGLSQIMSGRIPTAIKNAIVRGDKGKTKRNLMIGENHVPLIVEDNKIGWSNYAGPHTKTALRLRRGDPPRTASDKTAIRHDIEYLTAKNTKDLTKADLRMIKKLKEIKHRGLDKKSNVNLILRGMQAKMLGERVGILKRGAFADFNPVSDSDQALYDKTIVKLEQSGYGGFPAMDLKEEIIRTANKVMPSKKIVSLIVDKLIPIILKRKTGSGKIPKEIRNKLIKISKKIVKRKKKEMKGEGLLTILGGIAISLGVALTPEIIKLITKIAKKYKKKRGSGLKKAFRKGPTERDMKRMKKIIESVLNNKSLLTDPKFIHKIIDNLFI